MADISTDTNSSEIILNSHDGVRRSYRLSNSSRPTNANKSNSVYDYHVYDYWTPTPGVKIVDNVAYFDWPNLQVRKTAKGWAVFTTADLPIGYLIPFGGEITTMENVEALNSNGRNMKERTAYLGGTRDSNVCLDAHPSLYPRRIPLHGWVGSLVNHPNVSDGERPNSELKLIAKDEVKNIPQYKHIDRETFLAIELIEAVPARKEILIDYRWNYLQTRWLNQAKSQTKIRASKAKRNAKGAAMTAARLNKIAHN
jgi:hypothetical protein